MDTQGLIDTAVETAMKAQIRDDICSRSVLVGLQTLCGDIPPEMVTASLSLIGGTGAASCSCGAYCAGLLGIGAVFNPTIEEELDNPSLQMEGVLKCIEYRQRFLKEMGTVMCPEIIEKKFGRAYYFTDPEQNEEFMSMDGHKEKCAEVVAIATKIAATMILDERY